MNTFYKQQREDALRSLISAFAGVDEVHGLGVDPILAFVEKEVASAFKRGLHTTRKPGGVEYPQSALRAGKLTPATANVEEIQQ